MAVSNRWNQEISYWRLRVMCSSKLVPIRPLVGSRLQWNHQEIKIGLTCRFVSSTSPQDRSRKCPYDRCTYSSIFRSFYRNKISLLVIWRLQYIHELKDEIVLFHEQGREWNGTMSLSPIEYISTFMRLQDNKLYYITPTYIPFLRRTFY